MIAIDTARRFRRIGIITISAVYFLILVGGIVRASGAGMGCPDWPTCFGQWIPPTDVSQLPANYQAIYAVGYQNTTFNPIKTWTEYLNRLTGASIGLLILMTVWSARHYLKADKTVFYNCLGVLLLVMVQAWLGSAVVASNLKPIMITLHMLLALLIVALLIYAIARSQRVFLQQLNCQGLPQKFRLILLLAMGMTLLQVAMGTQIREAVDIIANQHSYIDRAYWRDDFPVIFYVHRSFSALILFTNLWLIWKLHQTKSINDGRRQSFGLHHCGYALAGLIAAAILAGISLDRLGFPAVAQPIHLVLANLIFGMQFFIYIGLRYATAGKHDDAWAPEDKLLFR